MLEGTGLSTGAAFASAKGGPYAWLVVILLTTAFTLSIFDRMILTLLVGPIKSSLHLSDVKISLLQGLAFTLLYVIAGLPIGRLADSFSRRAIAGFSILTWSVMTSACAMATNFPQLFLARVGVGVGEAGLSPAANSLIADYFPPNALSRPIAFFSIGGSLGTGLALIFGGELVGYLTSLGSLYIPLAGTLPAWKAAFFVAGVPGILLAGCFGLLREPIRTGLAPSQSSSFGETLSFVTTHKHLLLPHFLGAAFATLSVMILHFWMPTLLIRSFGLSVSVSGMRYGLVVLLGGVGGLVFGGWLADSLTSRGWSGSHIFVAFVAVLASTVPLVLAPMAPNPWLALLLAGCAVTGLATAIALAPVALQILVPNQMRAQVYALYLLTISMLGYGLGPLSVAFLSDHIFNDEAKLRYSMSIVAMIAGPISGLCFGISLRRYRHRIATALT
jgi:MFS family permease